MEDERLIGDIGRSAAALAFVTAAVYEGVVIRRYSLQTNKWKRGVARRFAVISDLHSAGCEARQQRILGLLTRLEPDAILLAGDIMDEYHNPCAAAELIAGASRIAPVYYAPGNHEYRTGSIDVIARIVRRSGGVPLFNNKVHISGGAPLLVAGCEDSEKERQDPRYRHSEAVRGAFASIGGSRDYTILIAHRPEHIALYAGLGFDLVVSGHAHGGQWRLPPLVNGVYAAGQGLFPRYPGGCYRHGDTHHVIGRGVVTHRELPRIFNPPEIVSVTVNGFGNVNFPPKQRRNKSEILLYNKK